MKRTTTQSNFLTVTNASGVEMLLNLDAVDIIEPESDRYYGRTSRNLYLLKLRGGWSMNIAEEEYHRILQTVTMAVSAGDAL